MPEIRTLEGVYAHMHKRQTGDMERDVSEYGFSQPEIVDFARASLAALHAERGPTLHYADLENALVEMIMLGIEWSRTSGRSGRPTADDDAVRLIGEQQLQIARLIAACEGHEESFDDLWNYVVERFNPRDNDAWHPTDSIDEAATLIEQLSCHCPSEETDPDHDEPCSRCHTLGRYRNVILSR